MYVLTDCTGGLDSLLSTMLLYFVYTETSCICDIHNLMPQGRRIALCTLPTQPLDVTPSFTICCLPFTNCTFSTFHFAICSLPFAVCHLQFTILQIFIFADCAIEVTVATLCCCKDDRIFHHYCLTARHLQL